MALRDIDSARRKVAQSKDEGKAEASEEVTLAFRERDEAQELFRGQTAELRKLREEHAGLAGRLASALQLAQVSVIEADAAKAAANSAVADGQAMQSALTQATHRIQAYDAECAKLRAESSILRRECDTHVAELRKMQGLTASTGERASSTESDARRIKVRPCLRPPCLILACR